MWPFASRQDVQEETNALRTEFASHFQTIQQSLISEIRNIPQPQLPAPTNSPEIVQLSKQIFDLQIQVKELVQIIHQLSATTASGTSKPIHEAIQARINAALMAINALGAEHANWLEEHQLSHSEIEQMIVVLQQKHQASAHHVFPPEQKDTEPIEQV